MLKKSFLNPSIFIIALFSTLNAFATGAWLGSQIPIPGSSPTEYYNVYDVSQQTVTMAGVYTTKFLLALTSDGLYWTTNTDVSSQTKYPNWKKCNGQGDPITLGLPTRVFGPNNWGVTSSPYVYMTTNASGLAGKYGLYRFKLEPATPKSNSICTYDSTYTLPNSTAGRFIVGGFVPPNFYSSGADQWIYILERGYAEPSPSIKKYDVLWITHNGGTNWYKYRHPLSDSACNKFNDVARDPKADKNQSTVFVAVSTDTGSSTAACGNGLYALDDPESRFPPAGSTLIKTDFTAPLHDEPLYKVFVRFRKSPTDTEVYSGGVAGLNACYVYNLSQKECKYKKKDIWRKYQKTTNHCNNGLDLAGDIITGIFAEGNEEKIGYTNDSTDNPDIMVTALSTTTPIPPTYSTANYKASFIDLLGSLGVWPSSMSNDCHHPSNIGIVDGGVAFIRNVDNTGTGKLACVQAHSHVYNHQAQIGGGPVGKLDINSFTLGVSGSKYQDEDKDNYLIGHIGAKCSGGGTNYNPTAFTP